MDLEAKVTLLNDTLQAAGSLLVAYSGGTDSAFLAFAAHRALGPKMLAVIADSPSLPRKELEDAVAFARNHAFPLKIVSTNELDDAAYRRNDSQRCFHCKDELFAKLSQLRESLGLAHIAYGRNLDDDGDFRPGQQAAAVHRVLAPLAEAHLTKADVRALARMHGLALADKPASACLASRIEYGRPVTSAALAQVEKAEDALHCLGFLQVRVRHHGDLARIEIAREDLPRALDVTTFERIEKALKPAGFTYLTLDLQGYRSGSMNAVLPLSTLLVSSQRERQPVELVRS